MIIKYLGLFLFNNIKTGLFEKLCKRLGIANIDFS